MSVGGGIGRVVGRTGRRALYRTPGLRTLAARVRPRACVLVYHRIAQSRSDPFGQTVTPARFARQLDAVRGRHHLMSVNELIGARHTADYPDGTVAVTFDDGYEDTLTAAYPTAARLGVPIHVFVTAGPVAAEEHLFWWDELGALSSAGCDDYRALHHELRHLPTAAREARVAALRNDRRVHEPEAGRPLTRAELAELASLPLAAIGSHTLTHPTLAALSSAEQLVELSEGRRRLEDLTGVRIDVLAYPFGKDADITGDTPRLAAEAGYVAAFLSTPRVLVPSSDPFLLPRLSVHDWPAECLLERIGEVLGPVGR